MNQELEEMASVQAIAAAIGSKRLGRYSEGLGDEHAINMYVWNAKLCEAFYFPLQIAEIISRNAVAHALAYRFGVAWYGNQKFKDLLQRRMLDELNKAIAEESYQHQGQMSSDHVVSAISFGFWEYLLSREFTNQLWAGGLKHQFPNAPKHARLWDLKQKVESIRALRNRIAHHNAIFDRKPAETYQSCLTVIGWRCAETSKWVASHSKVSQTINLRPTVSATAEAHGVVSKSDDT